MIHAAFLIPLFPLAGFLLFSLFGRRARQPAGRAGSRPAMVAASFVVTVHRLRRAVPARTRLTGSYVEHLVHLVPASIG